MACADIDFQNTPYLILMYNEQFSPSQTRNNPDFLPVNVTEAAPECLQPLYESKQPCYPDVKPLSQSRYSRPINYDQDPFQQSSQEAQ